MHRAIRFAAALTVLFVSVAQSADVLLIVDGSNSMWGQIEGKNKIVIAREAVAGVVAEIPDETGIGLIAYGHRREGDCEDIEQLAPIATGQAAAVVAAVNAVKPKGKTPITAALSQAFDVVDQHDNPVTVILVSDGLETCELDPCELVKTRLDPERGTLLHVVGFDVGDDVGQLACAAEAGGGLFLAADNADQLATALQRVSKLSAEEMPDDRLVVTVRADGELQDSGVYVFDADSGEEIYYGRTYRDEPTNPHGVPLEPGVYRVEVRALGFSSKASLDLGEIEIPDDNTVVEREVNFRTGVLRIGVTSNGELADAMINVLAPGSTESVAGGRTYAEDTSNPRTFRVLSGVYDISIAPLGVDGFEKRVIENVTVEAGGEVRFDESFDSGVLKVGVTRNGELSDATVKILHAGTNESVAGGRTYTTSANNPATYEILPGTYDILLKSTEVKGAQLRIEDVVVESGKEIRVDEVFVSGTLRIGVTRNGELSDATVNVVRADTGESVNGGRTYTRPASNPSVFELPPGTYDVVIRSTEIKGAGPITRSGVSVEPDSHADVKFTLESGTVSVNTLKDGQPVDAVVNVIDTTAGTSAGGGRTYGKPASWIVLPGTYDISIKPLDRELQGETIKGIIVSAGADSVHRVELAAQ